MRLWQSLKRRWNDRFEDALPVLVVVDRSGDVALVIEGDEPREFTVVRDSEFGEAA